MLDDARAVLLQNPRKASVNANFSKTPGEPLSNI